MTEAYTKSKFYTLSMFESQVLSIISKNNDQGISADELIETLKLPEATVTRVLNKHIATGNIKLKDGRYTYSKPIDGQIIMLEGSYLYPVSVIETSDATYVTRGTWYKFDKGFDIRRVVWNCQMNNIGTDQNRSLVDLLISSIIKERKSDIVHQSDYDYLVNKLVPYSSEVLLHIRKVGEIKTEIIIVFNIVLHNEDKSVAVNHRKFGIKSEIDTEQLLTELEKDPENRDYNNIKLNRMLSINDMLYNGNEIPTSYGDDKESLNVLTIKRLKTGIQFIEKSKNMFSNEEVIDEHNYDNTTEGLGFLISNMSDFVLKLLKRNDFEIDLEP